MSGVPVFRAAAQIEDRTWGARASSTAAPQPSLGPCPQAQHFVARQQGARADAAKKIRAHRSF